MPSQSDVDGVVDQVLAAGDAELTVVVQEGTELIGLESLLPALLARNPARAFDVVDVLVEAMEPRLAAAVWRLSSDEVGQDVAEPFLVRALDAAERACAEEDADEVAGWELVAVTTRLARLRAELGRQDDAREVIARARLMMRRRSWMVLDTHLLWEALEAATAQDEPGLVARWGGEALLATFDLALTEGQTAVLARAAAMLYYRTEEHTLALRIAQRSTPLADPIIGFTLMRLERFEEALEFLGAIVRDDPENDRERFNLAAVQDRVGRRVEAIKTLDALLERGETRWKTLTLRSTLMAKAGNLAEAVADFETAVPLIAADDVSPSELGHITSVAESIVAAGGSLDRVVAALDGIEVDAEAESVVRFVQGRMLVEAGRDPEGIARFEQALVRDAPLWPARIALVTALLRVGDPQGAASAVGPLAARTGDPEEASKILALIVERDPRREHRRLLAYADVERMHYAEAEAQLTRLLEEDGDDAQALRLRGVARLSSATQSAEDEWSAGATLGRFWDGIADLARATVLGDEEARAAYRWAVDRARANALIRTRLVHEGRTASGMYVIFPGLEEVDVALAVAMTEIGSRRWTAAAELITEVRDRYAAFGFEVEAARTTVLLADVALRLRRAQEAWDLLGESPKLVAAAVAPLTTSVAEYAQQRFMEAQTRGDREIGIELEVMVFTTSMVNGSLAYETAVRMQALAMLGRTEEAISTLGDPRELIRKLAGPSALTAPAEAGRAIMAMLRDAGQPREALELQDDVMAVAASDHRRAVVHQVAATCWYRLGDVEQTLREVGLARAAWPEPVPDMAFALDQIEAIALSDTDPERALSLLEREITHANVNPWRDGVRAHAIAQMLHRLGRLTEAYEMEERAEAFAAEVDDVRFDPGDRAAALGLWVEARLLRCRIAVETGDEQGAVDLISEMKARVLADDQQRALGSSRVERSPVMDALLKRRDALVQLLQFAQDGSAGVDWEALRALEDMSSSLVQEDGSAVRLDREAAEAALGRIGSQLDDLYRRPDPAAAPVEAQGAAGDAVPDPGFDDGEVRDRIEALVLDDELVLCGYGPDDRPWVGRYPLDVKELERLATRLTGDGATAWLQEDELWDSVPLRAVARAIRERTSPAAPVVLIPHGPLHQLPLHAVDDGEGMLGADRTLSSAPSAAVLRGCRRLGRRPLEHAVIVADSLDDLPHARLEGRSVAGVFGVAPLLGIRADRRRLLGLLSDRRPDILHIACHGTFSAEHPDASRIHLAGGLSGRPDGFGGAQDLTARDLTELSLSGTIAVLSACHSGAIGLRAGNEPFGLVRALLVAGARAVVATRWAVSDVSTWLMMERFTEYLVDSGGEAAMALRAAQAHVRNLTATGLVEACAVALEDTRSADGAAEALLHQRRADALRALGDDVASERDALVAQRLRGDAIGSVTPGARAETPVRDEQWRPFGHPWYWAGFTVFGDGGSGSGSGLAGGGF